jgi:hypothetical protein
MGKIYVEASIGELTLIRERVVYLGKPDMGVYN